MNAFSTPAEVDDPADETRRQFTDNRNNGEFVYFKNVPQRLDYEGNHTRMLVPYSVFVGRFLNKKKEM